MEEHKDTRGEKRRKQERKVDMGTHERGGERKDRGRQTWKKNGRREGDSNKKKRNTGR